MVRWINGRGDMLRTRTLLLKGPPSLRISRHQRSFTPSQLSLLPPSTSPSSTPSPLTSPASQPSPLINTPSEFTPVDFIEPEEITTRNDAFYSCPKDIENLAYVLEETKGSFFFFSVPFLHFFALFSTFSFFFFLIPFFPLFVFFFCFLLNLVFLSYSTSKD